MLHQQLFKEFSSTFHLPCHQRRENTKVTPPPAWHHYGKHFNGNHGSGHPPTKWPYQVTVPSLILLRLKEKKTLFIQKLPGEVSHPTFPNPTKKTQQNCPKNSDNHQKKTSKPPYFFGGVSFWTQPFRSNPETSTSDPCFVEGDRMLSSTKSPPVARKALKDPAVGKLDLSVSKVIKLGKINGWCWYWIVSLAVFGCQVWWQWRQLLFMCHVCWFLLVLYLLSLLTSK